MSQQVLGFEKPEPDVRGSGPLLQLGRVEVVLGGRPLVQDRDRYLSALERHDLGVEGRAYDGVVAGYRRVAVDAEVREAVVVRVGEVLPGRPALAVVLTLLQHPKAGPGRVAHLDVHVRHVEFLRNATRAA